MRRLISVAALAAISIGLLVPAADAATPTISYKGLPAGLTNASVSCVADASATLSATHVSGPATPPAGSGSLRIVEANDVSGGIQADFSSTEPSLSAVTAFDAYLYARSSDGVPASLLVEAYDPSTNRDYEFSLDLTAPDKWVHLNAATATMSWVARNGTTGVTVATGKNSLATFMQAPEHANVKLEALVVAGSCDPGAFYVDALNYAVGPTADTLDFEAPLPSTLANFSRPTSVRMGTVVTLGARLTHSSAPAAGETVSLYAHSVGRSFQLIKTLTTDSTGAVSFKVAPNSTTTYQWRYSGANTNYAPVNASAFTIASRQLVAVTSKPTAAAYGTNAVVKGRITPHKGGVTVRLVRLVNGNRMVVASAKTTYGGYFTIKAPMKLRGTWTYTVSALPYPGQDLGQSATFKVTTK
ncbi:MAG: hypothetical protein ACTHJM_00835 [Marmoricola sp.]